MKIERVEQLVVRPATAAAAAAVECVPWVALSTADLMVTPVYVEWVVAYEAPAPTSAELQKALAEALCGYREWAGRLVQAHPAAGFRPAILLNDAGVTFIDAVADAPLHHLLPSFRHLSDHLLLELIPPHRTHLGPSDHELLLVQVTRFTCGGMTIGFASNHRVADGTATVEFMNAWALISKGLMPPVSSSNDRSSMMARDPPEPKYDDEDFKWPLIGKKTHFESLIPVEKQKLVVRKLNFSAQFLQEIKEEARRGGGEYTKFECLVGHLWRCITRARVFAEKKEKGNTPVGEGITRIIVPVNARKRMDNSTLDNGYFGNAVCRTSTKATTNNLIEKPIEYATRLIKEAIQRVDEEYVKSSLDFASLMMHEPPKGGRVDGSALNPNLCVNSWARFPLYDLDFGTGRPLFAGNPTIPFEGLVIVLPPPPPHDGGFHVVLGLFESAMENLLSFYDTIF